MIVRAHIRAGHKVKSYTRGGSTSKKKTGKGRSAKNLFAREAIKKAGGISKDDIAVRQEVFGKSKKGAKMSAIRDYIAGYSHNKNLGI